MKKVPTATCALREDTNKKGVFLSGRTTKDMSAKNASFSVVHPERLEFLNFVSFFLTLQH